MLSIIIPHNALSVYCFISTSVNPVLVAKLERELSDTKASLTDHETKYCTPHLNQAEAHATFTSSHSVCHSVCHKLYNAVRIYRAQVVYLWCAHLEDVFVHRIDHICSHLGKQTSECAGRAKA